MQILTDEVMLEFTILGNGNLKLNVNTLHLEAFVISPLNRGDTMLTGAKCERLLSFPVQAELSYREKELRVVQNS